MELCLSRSSGCGSLTQGFTVLCSQGLGASEFPSSSPKVLSVVVPCPEASSLFVCWPLTTSTSRPCDGVARPLSEGAEGPDLIPLTTILPCFQLPSDTMYFSTASVNISMKGIALSHVLMPGEKLCCRVHTCPSLCH